MKTHNKIWIGAVIALVLTVVIFSMKPAVIGAASDVISQWLRANSLASSDGVSLRVEFSPTSNLSSDFTTTNTVEDILEVERTSSGSPTAGIGTGIALLTETAAGNIEKGVTLDAVTTDVTGASEDFDLVIGLMDAGAAAAERFRITSDGPVTSAVYSALTNTVLSAYQITHETSGSPANSIGTGLTFVQETSAGNNESVMALNAVITDVTGASEDAKFSVELMAAGAAKAEKFSIGSTGIVSLVNAGTIDNTANGTVKIDEPSAATNTVVDILTIGHSTSGTAANGIGTGIAFQTEDDGGAVQTGMALAAVTTDVTAASEDYDFVVSLMDGGTAAAERFRVDSDGLVTLRNGATIDNTVNHTLALAEPAIYLNGAIKTKTCVIADGDATPDVTGCTVLTTSANTGATEITDLDNPVVGAIYILIGGSATNSSTISDAGNFALSAGFTATVDETLTLFVQADNDYIELTRSTN